MRAQDAVFVIVAVAINPKGRDMAWEFFKSNNQKLLEQYQVKQLKSQLTIQIIKYFFFCKGWFSFGPTY